MCLVSEAAPSRVIGRYAIYDEIASGGMASVHLGRLLGSIGFSRTVAIKCLHPHLARDPEFVKMFLDEARVAARIRHPNVVPTLDVVNTDGELFLVMEYVQGESLARLVRIVEQRGERIPVPVACSIAAGVLQGLHAAHEATTDRGVKLEIVHRDVSPQNIMVGRDGVAHVLDFGVAKATGRLQTTREGQIKGKVAYMPPEQIRGADVTRATDIYAASVVLWELLVGQRLFPGENDANVLERVLFREVDRPNSRGASIPTALEEVVMRGLARDPAERFSTARDMARAIEEALPIATSAEVGEWLEDLVGDALSERQRKVTEIESSSDIHPSSQYKEAVASLAGDAINDGPKSGQRARVKAPSSAPTAGPTPDRPQASASEEGPLPASAWAARKRLVLVASTLALAGIVTTLALSRRSPVQSGAIAPAQVTAPVVQPDAPEQPPTASVTASTATAATASAPPIAAAPTGRQGRPVSTRPNGGGKSEIVRDLPVATASAKPVKPGCNPPFTVDAQGVKQYKLECL